jgi:hypothetical protein
VTGDDVETVAVADLVEDDIVLVRPAGAFPPMVSCSRRRRSWTSR